MRRLIPLLLLFGCDAKDGEVERPFEPAPCAASEVLTDGCARWEAAQVYVLTSMEFVTIEDGVTQGFDLDERLSTTADMDSCRKADFVDAEGREGIDNQLGVLWPAIKGVIGDALDGLIQGAINDGRLLIGLGLGDGMGVRRLIGAPLLGTDGRILADQTFALDAETPPALAQGGWTDEVFEAGPADIGLPIAIFDFEITLSVRNSNFRFEIQEDGTLQGVFAGGLSVKEFADELDTAAVPQSLKDLARNMLSNAADLDRDESGTCRRLSSSVAFTAVPAWVSVRSGAPPQDAEQAEEAE